MKFIPDDFKVPDKYVTQKFLIRKLCARDVYLDYMAVLSNSHYEFQPVDSVHLVM